MGVAIICAALVSGCFHRLSTDQRPSPMNDTKKTNQIEVAAAFGTGQTATLHAEFFYSSEARTVYVRYRIHNTSADRALAIFDRGVYGDWAGARYAPGPVGRAVFQRDGDGLTVAHMATALLSDDPLQRSMPLALALPAGGTIAAESASQLPAEDVPARLRWCIAVMPFDQQHFRSPHQTDTSTIWIATPDVVDLQQMLCTPWYDVAAESFQAG